MDVGGGGVQTERAQHFLLEKEKERNWSAQQTKGKTRPSRDKEITQGSAVKPHQVTAALSSPRAGQRLPNSTVFPIQRGWGGEAERCKIRSMPTATSSRAEKG